MKRLAFLPLACLTLGLLFNIPHVSAQNGSQMDLLRYQVIPHEPDQLAAMQSDLADVMPNILDTRNAEMLDSEGFTVTMASAFHMTFMGFNIRDTATIRAYYRPEITYWPLHDVEFRHAMFHCYDLISVIQLMGYNVGPMYSLVPPAQGRYFDPNVITHPYNPGNPFTSPAGEHSTCGLLKEAGYTFVDAGKTGIVDNADYWKCPDSSPLPKLTIWWPLVTVSPEYVPPYISELFEDFNAIGLAATAQNGDRGLANEPRDIGDYRALVFGSIFEPGGFFDGFWFSTSLGNLPTQLYDYCHSSQDSLLHFGALNAVGINDEQIDSLTETIKFSLNMNEIASASKQVQERLSDPTLPNADNFALAYLGLYSRQYMSAFNPSLRGIINSQGFGSGNDWTFLNARWEPGLERWIDSKKAAIWILERAPATFNPLVAHSETELEILGQVFDGLVNMNPFDHSDIPWIATDWSIVETAGGMEIDFAMRNDVLWQDGKPFTAYDAEFCLELMNNMGTQLYITDAIATDATHLKIIAEKPSIMLFYEYANRAAMLPKHIWDRNFSPNIFAYDPTESYNVAPGYTPGPTPTPTNLFGTGPFVFQFYNPEDKYCDLWTSSNYLNSNQNVQDLLTELFWKIGDLNRDGIVDVYDLTITSFAFGYTIGQPGYNPDADFNSDGIIDMRDVRLPAFHLTCEREYP